MVSNHICYKFKQTFKYSGVWFLWNDYSAQSEKAEEMKWKALRKMENSYFVRCGVRYAYGILFPFFLMNG